MSPWRGFGRVLGPCAWLMALMMCIWQPLPNLSLLVLPAFNAPTQPLHRLRWVRQQYISVIRPISVWALHAAQQMARCTTLPSCNLGRLQVV